MTVDALIVHSLIDSWLCNQDLRRGHTLEASSNLLLPWQANLGVDLRRRLEVLDALIEQASPEHDAVGAQRLLRVVDMRGAVLAVVAVDTLACQSLVRGREAVVRLGEEV